ncbi:NUDIX hydrolase [Sediminibacterium soli]|uniref:NUDIX hydrolase n=1 Tax=Sediminibacterium soli TaxID=2698829 RepID=UPI00137A1961|nr:NUDIX hydrolase [Sediminibacterium soli]NCI46033.1 NUDIX hydrolase [Sediminibacterium soli]
MERDMTWKTLSSRQLFSETWMNVRADTCEKPDGSIVSPYYVYEFPEWVTALAITKDGQVILERQYRHALGRTDLELPGGCVDRTDASFEAAVARELLEETGFRFERFVFLGQTSANPSTNTNLMHMYLATGGEKVQEQELDAGEDIDIVLVSMDELVELFRKQQFIQSMHMVAISLALQHLGRIHIQ